MPLNQVILLGLALEVPASLTLFFFKDEHALGEESDALHTQVRNRIESLDLIATSFNRSYPTLPRPLNQETSVSSCPQFKKHTKVFHESSCIRMMCYITNCIQMSLNLCFSFLRQDADGDDSAESKAVERTMCGIRLTTDMIPYLLFAGDVISALASGMTIKFFGLWFKNVLGLDPVQVLHKEFASACMLLIYIRLFGRARATHCCAHLPCVCLSGRSGSSEADHNNG